MTIAFRAIRALGIALPLAILIGCGGSDVLEDEPRENGPTVSPEAHDLTTVMQRTRLAFATRNGVMLGGTGTYGAKLEHGELEVTPYDWSTGAEVGGAGLRLRTLAVSGEDGRLSDRRASVNELGHVEFVGTSATEVIRNTPEGVEQVWRFAKRPMLGGDLVVAVSVSGQRFTGASDSGLHFMDDASGLGVAYSHGTWVDAAGKQTPVRASFEYG